MRRRIDPHRRRIWIFGCNVVVHLEKIAVAFFDRGASKTADRVREIEIDAASTRADASSVVTDFFCGARGDIARSEISEARIFPLQIVVALRFGDFLWLTLVA